MKALLKTGLEWLQFSFGQAAEDHGAATRCEW